MSNLGLSQSPKTRAVISQAKTKFDPKILEKSYNDYLLELKDNPELCPSLAGLAKRYGMSTATISNNMHLPQVAHIIETIQTLQEAYLIENGITGKASPSFAQFLLKAKHSYSDDKPTLTQNNFMNISPEVLQDALELMAKSPNK